MAPIRMWAFFSVACAILLFLPAIAYATDYVVGDNDGWTTGFNYSEWAKDKKFRVGDSLIFIYSEGYHNVAKVDGKSFAGCAVPPNATVLTSGNDKITLTTTGNKWYICGVSGHCEAGQKLKITVLPKSMIGSAPSPAPEVVVPGVSWAPVPVAPPGYLPEDMMNGVPIPAPDSALPLLPWAPTPVETPGSMPGEEEGEALQLMPTMPPEPAWPPAVPPVVPRFPWAPTPVETPGSMPGEEEGEALQLMPTMPPEPAWPPAVPPVVPRFPWAPTPVETPGSMPGEEEGEALQLMPTMPPGTWVLPEPAIPPPVETPGSMPGAEEEGEALQLMPTMPPGTWVPPEPAMPPAMPPVVRGFQWAPTPVETPGSMPGEEEEGEALQLMPTMPPEPVMPPAMPPVVRGFQWAPTPVETPGSMPGEEEEGEALQLMPTMPPGTWVSPEPVWPPVMPPVAGGPWSS